MISFVATVFVVRYLGPTNYGQLSYALNFIGLFTIFSSLGLPQILSRDLLLYPEKRNVIMGTATTLHFIGGLFAFALVNIFAYTLLEKDVAQLAIFLLSSTLILNLYQPLTHEFGVNVQQKYLAVVSIFVVILLNLLKFAVIISDGGVLWFISILVLEPILYMFILGTIRTKLHGPITSWRFENSTAVELLKNSWPFIFIAGFTVLFTRIDQVILKHLLGPESVGVYDVAVRLSELWLFVPSIIATSLYPAIVNAKKSSVVEYKRRLLNLLGILLAFSLPLVCVLLLISEPLILFLYGEAFSEAINIFRIYAWSSIILSIYVVTHHFLITENHRKTIFVTTLCAALINIALNYLLIPHLGTAGAAWSTLIAYLVLILPLIQIFKLGSR